MNNLTRLLEHITAAGFLAIGAVAVRDWLRRRDRGLGFLALALCLLAAVAVLGSLGDAFNLRYTVIVDAALVALMGSGYALLRFRGSFLPLSTRAHALAGGAVGITTLLVLASDLNPQPNAVPTGAQTAAITAAVLVWCLCIGEPVLRFWRSSHGRPAVQRARLRALCAGYAGLIVILLLAILPSSISSRDAVQIGLQVGALVVVPLLYVSFAPPGWLKRSWREKEEEAMRRAVEELLNRSDDGFLSDRALDWALRLVGADAGALVNARGEVVLARGVDQAVAVGLWPLGFDGARVVTLPGSPPRSAVVAPVPSAEGAGALITVSGPFTPVYGDEEVLRLGQYAVSTGTALERNRLAAAVRSSEERFRMLVEGVHDYALFTLSVDGTVSTWNAGGERLKGYAADEIIGKSFAIFSTPEDIAAGLPSRALDAAATAGRYECEGWRMRKDGSRFYANVLLTALHEDGEVTGFVKMTRDITDKRQIEEALLAARDTAEIASRVKSDFLSRMSHELRTPLNAVLGFAELLMMDDNLTPDQLDMVDTIRKAGSHQLDLINDVLDISRIESGHLSLSNEPIAVDELISEAMHLLHPQAASRGITLRRSASTRVLHALADRQRLKQVLINLVSNAVKYNREGGEVEVTAEVTAGRLRVTVRDTGAGLTPAEVARLFRPFERLGRNDVEGTGLGLALSRHLVEAMGGTLEVESTPGVGSSFHVDLVAAAEGEVARTQHETLSGIPFHRGARERVVLYIEDNLSNLDLVQKILARRPHIRVISAPQGSIGIQATRDHLPDLVLLDLHLPDMTGGEVLRRLKAEPATREIPVVVISADATREQVTTMLEAGAVDYLTKPLDIRRFLAVLETTFNEHSDGSAVDEAAADPAGRAAPA